MLQKIKTPSTLEKYELIREEANKKWWTYTNEAFGYMWFEKKETKKRTKKEIQATKSKEYLEFESKYPRKVDMSKPELVNKYNKLVEQGKHKEIIEWLERYIRHIEVENKAESFIKHAYTWINANWWENEYKVLETRFWANEKWISDALQNESQECISAVLEAKKLWEKKNQLSEFSKWVLDQMVSKYKNSWTIY